MVPRLGTFSSKTTNLLQIYWRSCLTPVMVPGNSSSEGSADPWVMLLVRGWSGKFQMQRILHFGVVLLQN